MKITHRETVERIEGLHDEIADCDFIYPVPKSGLIIAFYLQAYTGGGFDFVESLAEVKEVLKNGGQIAIIDDVKDSGYTEEKLKKYFKEYLNQIEFFYVVDKQEEGIKEWVEFPWNDFDSIRDEKDKELRAQQRNENIPVPVEQTMKSQSMEKRAPLITD